jgi:DNA-binding winged helix-turn-helix (wHTH) protein
MATKPYAIRITADAHPVAAAQDSSATNARRTSTTREHHQLRVEPLRACLGEFEVDLRTGELRAGASIVRLQEQPFQILRMLLERNVEMVTRDEIQEALWPDGTIVDFDHSINAAIKKLRRAFGDSADHPHYIETVARRGYRLMVPVQWSHYGRPARPSAEEVPNGRPSPRPIGPPADNRIATHRHPQILAGGTSGAATSSLRASRTAHQPHGKAGQSFVVMVQRRELEDHLLCLEKMVLARIRRLRHRQRCMYRLRTSARG